MRYNTACLILSYLLVLILISSCSDPADVSQIMPVSVDTQQVIHEFFEKDSQKRLDTLKVVYKLGDEEEYIRGVIIRKAKVIIPPSYNNDSVSKVLRDILTYAGYANSMDKEALFNFKTFTCKRDSMTLNDLLKELNKQTKPFYFWRSEAYKMIYADVKVREDSIILKKDNVGNYVIESPVGSQIQLTFDQSKVWLNAGTRLLINGSFSKNRYLRVNGEVYVDLKANKDSVFIETQRGHKFILKQGGLTVNTFADSNHTASLNHGTARLLAPNGSEQTTLNGRQCITFGLPNVLIKRAKADPADASSWSEGFIAHDATLNVKSYFEQLGRWYDVSIKMPKYTLTYGWNGRIPLGSSFKNVLKVLETCNVNFSIKVGENGKLEMILL